MSTIALLSSADNADESSVEVERRLETEDEREMYGPARIARGSYAQRC